MRAIALLTCIAVLSTSATALAQGDSKKPAGAKPDADGVRRDEKGVTGISPFWEAVNEGDRKFVARDYDAAIGAYRKAIEKEPQNALGHYRMGQAHVAKNDLKEAKASYQAALRYVGGDNNLKAKLLFVMADLHEREKQYDEAIKAWDEYAKFEQPETQVYTATAQDRKKRIETWKKLVEEYDAVKKRIAKRLAETDKK